MHAVRHITISELSTRKTNKSLNEPYLYVNKLFSEIIRFVPNQNLNIYKNVRNNSFAFHLNSVKLVGCIVDNCFNIGH